jgi:ubiquitin-conjugating enzyme E2 variant
MPFESLKSKDLVVIPRNFRLLDELEEIEKAKGGMINGISYGLETYDDNILLENWIGVIISNQYQNIYNLKIYCSREYPNEPPTIQFINQIPQLNFVDQFSGVVNQKLLIIRNWDSKNKIKDILQEIQKHLI